MWGQKSPLISGLVVVLLLGSVAGSKEDASQLREKMQVKLQVLKNKLKGFQEVKGTLAKSTDFIKTQVENTEKRIKQEFEELHRFLRDEEAARIAALKAEEAQKGQMIDDKINLISDKIKYVEENLAADDAQFVQNYKNTILKAEDRERLSVLIDQAKYVGNLKFNIWRKMQDIVQYTPVILDPNTAHEDFILSDDLTSLKVEAGAQQVPNIPGRFNTKPSILGYEGYDSGVHTWEVDVGESNYWVVGVMREGLARRGHEWPKNSGRWYVYCEDGNCGMHSPPQLPVPIVFDQKIKKIRVQLDWDRGNVTFTYPDQHTFVHTLEHKFNERVYPYLCASMMLRVLPVNATVSVQ